MSTLDICWRITTNSPPDTDPGRTRWSAPTGAWVGVETRVRPMVPDFRRPWRRRQPAAGIPALPRKGNPKNCNFLDTGLRRWDGLIRFLASFNPGCPLRQCKRPARLLPLFVMLELLDAGWALKKRRCPRTSRSLVVKDESNKGYHESSTHSG